MNKKHPNTKKNVDGIVESKTIIGENIVSDIDSSNEKGTNQKTTAKTDTKKNTKKSKKLGFWGKTLAELRLVEWPTWKYVVGWSATIILFTSITGSIMGFTDYYFESGIQFIDCTSPNGSKNKSTQDCLKDLTTNLTFQKYFNRQPITPTNSNPQPSSTESDTTLPIENIQPTITTDSSTIQTNEIADPATNNQDTSTQEIPSDKK